MVLSAVLWPKQPRNGTDYTVLGFDRNEAVLQQALQQGAIDGVLEPDQLKNCRIVLVALYPQAAVITSFLTGLPSVTAPL